MSNEVEALLEDKRSWECAIHPLLAQRRTLRAFCERRVEPETLRLILEAARVAPSSMNEQPWNFIIATRENELEFNRLLGCLLEFNLRWAQLAPVLLLSVARLTFTSTGEPNRHALHDVGQAMASLTFQASACGLAVCQMAGFDIEKARQEFSIPANHEPVVAAAIGYPGDPRSLPEKLQRKTLAAQHRKSTEEFVFESIWGKSAPTLATQPAGNQTVGVTLLS
jgi:nitroreductase